MQYPHHVPQPPTGKTHQTVLKYILSLYLEYRSFVYCYETNVNNAESASPERLNQRTD